MQSFKTDVVVIGSGLGSLTAAALLAKRGLKVMVVEQHFQPGGSCGAFRREDRTFDQGTSMLFGFGEIGFNPHRFVMNELSEPISVIKHRELYRLNYAKHPILFDKDIDKYLEFLSGLFPEDIGGIRAFYDYIGDLYHHVIAVDPVCIAPSEIPNSDGAKRFLRNPVRNIKLLRLLNQSAGQLMRKFVTSERVFGFFNKLTSTYCYTTLDETPAILAVTMFMENHTGGSYYPVGSSQQLPGKLEKSIEEHSGTILYDTKAVGLKFLDGNPRMVVAESPSGTIEITADEIIYGGTLLNLYTKMIDEEHRDPEMVEKVKNYAMTYPSVVLYCVVDASVLPEGTLPIEMMADNPDALDEKEVTVYAYSLADRSICKPNEHVVIAIGPSLREWPSPASPGYRNKEYAQFKQEELDRLIGVLESHYPGFSEGVIHAEVATPSTIEYYVMKEKGCVAGPKQMMGQDLLRRQHAKGPWPTLFFCGEGTVMGTGSPSVTISGIGAANMVLRKRKMKEYRYSEKTKNVVEVIAQNAPEPRLDGKRVIPSLNKVEGDAMIALHDVATACQWCDPAVCIQACPGAIDIRAIMRRLECGNLFGVYNILKLHADHETGQLVCASCSAPCVDSCLRSTFDDEPVAIRSVLLKAFEEGSAQFAKQSST